MTNIDRYSRLLGSLPDCSAFTWQSVRGLCQIFYLQTGDEKLGNVHIRKMILSFDQCDERVTNTRRLIRREPRHNTPDIRVTETAANENYLDLLVFVPLCLLANKMTGWKQGARITDTFVIFRVCTGFLLNKQLEETLWNCVITETSFNSRSSTQAKNGIVTQHSI